MERIRPESARHRQPGLWLGAFVLALSPLLTDHLLFHPDERHYLDGGLRMAESGDWLTPRTAEGDLRLHKPPLAYWCVGVGAWAFGASPWSTRCLFLLAAAGVVWWGWRGARAIARSADAAAIAGLALLMHPALLLSATRALPDVLLALGITASQCGFLTLLARGRADWGPLLTAALGAAVAILAKGLPGAAFLVYGAAYLAVREPSLVRVHWRRCLAALAVSLVFGGVWMIEMHRRHGDALVAQFFFDQGGTHRLSADLQQSLWQAVQCAGLLALGLAPVSLPAARTLWQRRQELPRLVRGPAESFLLGWLGLYLAAAASVNHVSLRYLLPAAPASALLLGILCCELDGPLLRRNLRWSAFGFLALLALTAVSAAGVSWSAGPGATSAGVAIALLLAAALARQMRFTGIVRSTAVVSGAALASVLILSLAALQLVGPSFGRQVAVACERESLLSGAATLTLIGEPAHATRVRICSGGRLPVRHIAPRALESLPDLPALAAAGPVAALDPALLQQPAGDLRCLAVPCGLHDITAAEFWQHLCGGRLRELVRSRQRTYFLALPNAPPQSSPHQNNWHQASSRDASPDSQSPQRESPAGAEFVHAASTDAPPRHAPPPLQSAAGAARSDPATILQ